MENILWFKVNIILHIYVFSQLINSALFVLKANYVLCMGPLMFAIIIWKNSLVFHSLDKLTSFFLHFFPPLHLHLFRCTKPSVLPLIYLYLFFIFISSRASNHPFTRLSSFLELFLLSWGLIPCKAIEREDSLSLHEGLLLPMLLYAIWQVQCFPPHTHTIPILLCQVVYLVITEGLLHKAMEEDSSLVTSMR